MSTPTKTDPPMVVRTAQPGGFARVNRTFSEELGYEAEELARKPLLDWIQPQDCPCFRKVLDAGHGTLQARHRTRNGDWVPFLWKVRSEPQGPIVLGLLHTDDRTEPKLRRVEEKEPDDSMNETLVAMARTVSTLTLFEGPRLTVFEGRPRVLRETIGVFARHRETRHARQS